MIWERLFHHVSTIRQTAENFPSLPIHHTTTDHENNLLPANIRKRFALTRLAQVAKMPNNRLRFVLC
jgi:hypothetical protein